MKRVIYAGSFDPITRGHLDIISKAMKLYDHVIIAVGKNSSKKGCFTTEERVQLIEQSLQEQNIPLLRNGVVIHNGVPKPAITVAPHYCEVASFEGLLVDFAKRRNVNFLVRGLRAVTDFEDEFLLNGTNEELSPDTTMQYFMASKKFLFIASSSAREIASHKGDVSWLVTPSVEEALKAKFQG